VLMESVIHELLCIQDTIRFTHTSSIRPFCICNKTQAVVLATFMGVHVIEIVHMGSFRIYLSIIHDMIHSRVPFVLKKKSGGRAGD